MNEEELKEFRACYVTILKLVGELKASEAAWQKVSVELLPHLRPELREIIARCPDYYVEFRMTALLELEKAHPRLTAELDAIVKLGPPNGDEEMPRQRPGF
jgi:hypothetical protein